VAGEQVFQDSVQAAVFFAVEFGILVKGEVSRAANPFYVAEHANRFASQRLEFFTHKFVAAVRNSTVREEHRNGTFVLRCGFCLAEVSKSNASIFFDR
jgi:hypothetical protein